MHGSSRGSAKAVQAAFDAVLAQGSSWAPLADELFAVTAVVDGSASLRRALADPSREAAEKQGLARAVFGAKVGQTTTALVGEVAGQRWSAERDLGDTLEALAVMSLLATAERAGHIDRVEDELFRFERIVAGDPGLRDALSSRNTDAAGQLEDIRNLIQAGVQAIVVNPANADGINAAIKEATDAGIVVVAVDQAVTEPSAYILSNNQEEYAYIGAKWLFETMGGKGAVVYMRGAAGAGADNDRDKGFKRAMAEFPDITVAQEVFTGWQQDQGKQQINDIIAAGVPFQGIWTSGIDNVIVDALVESGAPLVPVVGADNAGFVGQLSSVAGLQGAAVTNPGSVGGAGVALAIQILDGKMPAEKTTLVNPAIWDNVSEEGKAKLAAAANPNLSPEWPVSVSIENITPEPPMSERTISCTPMERATWVWAKPLSRR